MNSSFYSMLQNDVERERCAYQAYTILGDQQKANQSYKKILQTESLLCLMRTHRLTSKSIN